MVANLNKVEANKQAEADAPKTKTNDGTQPASFSK